MVQGLTIFRDRFRGLDDCYVLIGGTACDLWMGERALGFRATKDLDMVLVVEWPAIRQAVDNLPEPTVLLGQLRDVFMLEAGKKS